MTEGERRFLQSDLEAKLFSTLASTNGDCRAATVMLLDRLNDLADIRLRFSIAAIEDEGGRGRDDVS